MYKKQIRIIHTSDLVKDDENTLVRLFLFSNDQEILGIHSSASPWSDTGVIKKVFHHIDLYDYVSLIVIAILVTISNHILIEKGKFGKEDTIAKEDFDFGKRTIDKNSLFTIAVDTPIIPELIRLKNINPIKIIFDTDMDSDVDDVGALAMLHAMRTNGEVEILAVMVSSTCPGSAA